MFCVFIMIKFLVIDVIYFGEERIMDEVVVIWWLIWNKYVWMVLFEMVVEVE